MAGSRPAVIVSVGFERRGEEERAECVKSSVYVQDSLLYRVLIHTGWMVRVVERRDKDARHSCSDTRSLRQTNKVTETQVKMKKG